MSPFIDGFCIGVIIGVAAYVGAIGAKRGWWKT